MRIDRTEVPEGAAMFIGEIEEIGIIEPVEVPRTRPDEAIEPVEPAPEPARAPAPREPDLDR